MWHAVGHHVTAVGVTATAVEQVPCVQVAARRCSRCQSQWTMG